MSEQLTVTQEAHQIINGARRSSYGPADESFRRIATVWGAVLGQPITPMQVALCMVGLKLLRQAANHHRDNLVDLCGYAELADLIATSEATKRDETITHDKIRPSPEAQEPEPKLE
jgi:hypothetical protein